MKLHLAPHELEPNRRVQLDGEPFEFRVSWEGQEREFIGQIIWQKHQPMIFFALADEPERGNFVNASVFVSRNPEHPNPPICEPRTYFAIAQDNAKIYLEVTANEGWGRLFFVSEDLQPSQAPAWRLFLAQSGWGECSAAPDFYMKSARFRWNTNPDEARQLALLPPLQLLEQVRPFLLDPNSDAAHARRFAPLKNKARGQLCRPLQRGTYDEWEGILRLFLLSRTRVWTDKPKRRFHIYIYAKELRTSPKSCYFHLQFPRFYKWMKGYFAPTLDEEYLCSCVATRAWHKRRFSWSQDLNAPTQHEHMEALLRLREWLEGKASPDEIAGMLGEE